MNNTEREAMRAEFEAWFQAVELGDGDAPLTTPKDGRAWDEYVQRHALALGAWQAARAAQPAALPQRENFDMWLETRQRNCPGAPEPTAWEAFCRGAAQPVAGAVPRDALRYQALRSGRGYSVDMKGVTSVHCHRGEPDFGEALDKAADAMLAAATSNGVPANEPQTF